MTAAPKWLDAVREVARARVDQTRAPWMRRGRANTVHDSIDDILEPTPADSDEVNAAVDRVANTVSASSRWQRLVEICELPRRDIQWMALLTACEVDPRMTRVLAYLDDASMPVEPSPAAAAQFWGWPPGDQPGPASGVYRWRLATALDPDPWRSSTAWAVDADVAAYLCARDDWAGYRPGLRQPDPNSGECLYPNLLDEMAAAVSPILDRGTAACEVELVGEPGSGRRTLLTQLTRAIGLTPLVVPADLGVRALRTARLRGDVPVWVVDSPDTPVVPDTRPGALSAVAREAPSGATPDGVVRLSWRVPRLDRAARDRLWSTCTAHTPPPAALEDWDLSPADVALAAAATPAGPHVAASVIRRRRRAVSLTTMTPLECPYDWSDLIVADQIDAALHALDNQVRLTREVLDDWEFRRLCPTTSGVTALFGGPSGTGKTMAAQVLAASLDLDLYRVDLAEVVNKYVGETEKRLAQLFDECERTNVMVLFDEADALFGQRTRVRDAHDRFANIEIDYLLQRMDTFRGIAILATNRKGDLDPAFLRRIQVIVDFVPPAEPQRRRLWELALPSHTSAGAPLTRQVDHQWLARELELTGAQIKSIALAAAFAARQRGELIDAALLLEATRRELAKHGEILRVTDPTPAGLP
ncbi:AAA family ATPase [Rhodococcus spelaei]|uniref:AAA family ATPase n=1 Tax=Rhodococcus spelaei TaxID=2546320 RepID=A0A541B7K4_9NOCA|nr:ATP-binding protein [Rhodococcus spelaei]TQF68280.1 AAA family ATPase [Rhodococcus spelaei]